MDETIIPKKQTRADKIRENVGPPGKTTRPSISSSGEEASENQADRNPFEDWNDPSAGSDQPSSSKGYWLDTFHHQVPKSSYHSGTTFACVNHPIQKAITEKASQETIPFEGEPWLIHQYAADYHKTNDAELSKQTNKLAGR